MGAGPAEHGGGLRHGCALEHSKRHQGTRATRRLAPGSMQFPLARNEHFSVPLDNPSGVPSNRSPNAAGAFRRTSDVLLGEVFAGVRNRPRRVVLGDLYDVSACRLQGGTLIASHGLAVPEFSLARAERVSIGRSPPFVSNVGTDDRFAELDTWTDRTRHLPWHLAPPPPRRA